MTKPTKPAARSGTSRAQKAVATGQIADERPSADAALQPPSKTPVPPTEPGLRSLTRQQKWSRANPLKRWAHMALRSAVQKGLVTQTPCEDCGSEKSEAHHADYSRPIHVQWLCRACHMAAHKRLKGAVADATPPFDPVRAAAEWLVQQKEPPSMVVPILRERFALSVTQACHACRLAGELRRAVHA